MINYKSRYYRLLATFWIMIIVGACFFWNIWGTLTRLDKDIHDFKTQQEIQMYIDSGWVAPYDQTKRMTKDGK
jgi:hypothetical protein